MNTAEYWPDANTPSDVVVIRDANGEPIAFWSTADFIAANRDVLQDYIPAFSNALHWAIENEAVWPDLYSASLAGLAEIAGFVRWTGRAPMHYLDPAHDSPTHQCRDPQGPYCVTDASVPRQ